MEESLKIIADQLSKTSFFDWFPLLLSVIAIGITAYLGYLTYQLTKKVSENQKEASINQQKSLDQQNKIALFDKRYEAISEIRKIFVFASVINKEIYDDFDNWKNDEKISFNKLIVKVLESTFEFDLKEFDTFQDKLTRFNNSLDAHIKKVNMSTFIFEGKLDCGEVYWQAIKSLMDFAGCIFKKDVTKMTELKKKFVDASNKLEKSDYFKQISKQLSLTQGENK